MALVNIDRYPTPNQLRAFGKLLVVFAAVAGALLWWRTGRLDIATTIWLTGAALASVYWVAPALRRPIYVGWMWAVFPIGWTVSHVLILAIYYMVLTPIALCRRAAGHDQLQRRFDTAATTYWVRYTPQGDVRRYFKQF